MIKNRVEFYLESGTSETTKVKIKYFLDSIFENIKDEKFLDDLVEFIANYKKQNSSNTPDKFISYMIID